jgi:hypothetical protein
MTLLLIESCLVWGPLEFGVFQGVNEFLIFLFLNVLQDAILP